MPDIDLQSLKPAPDAGRGHVFIVGSSRTGTSAFARLLGRHGDVAIGIERYIQMPLTDGPESFPRDLFTAERFFASDYDLIKNDRGHHRLLREKFSTTTWVGDKVPDWLYRVRDLRAAYPGAQVFCMLRDPVDVALSFVSKARDATAGYWKGKTFEDGLRACMASLREAERLLTDGVGGFHMVEYDRIFPYDPDYLAAVLRHMGLTPDEKIIGYYRDTSEKSEAITRRDRQLTDEQAAAAARMVDPELFAFLRTHSVARH